MSQSLTEPSPEADTLTPQHQIPPPPPPSIHSHVVLVLLGPGTIIEAILSIKGGFGADGAASGIEDIPVTQCGIRLAAVRLSRYCLPLPIIPKCCAPAHARRVSLNGENST